MNKLRIWLQDFTSDLKEKNIQQVWYLYKPYFLGIFVVVSAILGLSIFGISQAFVADSDDPTGIVSDLAVDSSNQSLVATRQPLAQSESTSSPVEVTSESAHASENETWYVDIKGAVKVPQVVPVSSGMRVHDVVEAAGGLTEEADQSQVNLALLVTDQMVIYVPKVGEEVSPSTQALIAEVQSPEDDQGGQTTSEGDLVNINTADATTLQTLSGIGEKRAADIIQYREMNGPFATVDDLDQVSGIGDKTMEKLRPFITVN
jgi:competence protein ComEA